MNTVALLGLAVYLAGHGARGLPSGGLTGSTAMIVGGVLVGLSLVLS